MSSATLTGLPVEILQQICQSFCWHCHGFTYNKLRETHQRCLERRSSSCHVSERSLESAPLESAEPADDSELESSVDKNFENRNGVKSSQRLVGSSSDIHLWLYNGKKCLDSLSKSCRLLRAIAQPILYHKIYLTNGPLTPQRVVNIVETLKNRRDLRSCVFELYFHDHPFRHAGNMSRDDLARGICHDRYLQICNQKQGRLLYSLLYRTPNLIHAYIRIPNDSWFLLGRRLAAGKSKKSLCILPRFESLIVDHTELRPNGEKRFRGEFKVREYALRFFRVVAPNLISLQFNWPVEVKSQFREMVGPGGLVPDDLAPFYNLTEISLIGTNNRRCLGWKTGYTSVMHLLSAAGPHLSKVKMEEHLPEDDSSQPPVWFNFEALLALLQPWKATLRELSFNVTPYVYPRTVGGRQGIRCQPLDQDGLALLSEFDSLEILRLDLGSGFSIDAAAGDPITPVEFVSSLSPRLGILQFWASGSIPGEIESKYTDIVRCLLEAVQAGGFLELKTFYCAVPVPVPGGSSNEAERRGLEGLGREFARNGIQFELVEGGYSGEAAWSEEL